MSRPVLVLLHGLGGSARSWHLLSASLGGSFEYLALDLPGFGASPRSPVAGVESVVDWIADRVRTRAPDAWMIVGHSMGGKFATLLAARAEGGENGLDGLKGVVLLAGSPPSPEPMDEDRRHKMLDWAKDGPLSPEDARTFVCANIAGDLPGGQMDEAVVEVCRSDAGAWTDWLEHGSREDWSSRLQAIRSPSLILAGAEDGDLGIEAQETLNRPFYRSARVAEVAGSAHLLMIEQPEAVARLIRAHWERIDRSPDGLPPAFAALLASDRVSERTRGILSARIDPPGGGGDILTPRQFATLQALLDRILPGQAAGLSLAERIVADLDGGPGDGWRFAELPTDLTAYRSGLDGLDALAEGFRDRTADEQDALLRRILTGDVPQGDASPGLDGAQLKLWFEDVRADAVRHWLSHPATMARIGYDGFANGGDGDRLQGFAKTAAGDREAWEPTAGPDTRHGNPAP